MVHNLISTLCTAHFATKSYIEASTNLSTLPILLYALSHDKQGITTIASVNVIECKH